MPAGPLAGVRVLDVTNTFMRPYATLLLAQQGADVLKVEQPGGDLRRRINDARGTRMGPIFLNTNRGKRSIVVDLGSADGSALFARLVAEHDVLVRNVLPPRRRPPRPHVRRGARPQPADRALRPQRLRGRRAAAPDPLRDGGRHLSITIYTDAHWRSFFALAGKPELTDNPRYATITAAPRTSTSCTRWSPTSCPPGPRPSGGPR